MAEPNEIFRPAFSFEQGIAQARDHGYYFCELALSEDTRSALEDEINSLPLEVGDHISNPINPGQPNEVKQQHKRLYVDYGDQRTPVANMVIDGLTKQVRAMKQFPELSDWQLTEVGYQRYRNGGDFIGAHRDRASDQKLSVTLTISGSAAVKIFKPLGEENDYSNLCQIYEHITGPGDIMLLRAPGLGNGQQEIHQVMPPDDSREIVNLRARPTILEQPSSPKWQS